MAILRHTGNDVPEATLRQRASELGIYDDMNGVRSDNFGRLPELLGENGVPSRHATGSEANIDSLARNTGSGRPAITRIMANTREGRTEHAVVVDAVEGPPGNRVIHGRDPANGPFSRTEESFSQDYLGEAILTN